MTSNMDYMLRAYSLMDEESLAAGILGHSEKAEAAQIAMMDPTTSPKSWREAARIFEWHSRARDHKQIALAHRRLETPAVDFETIEQMQARLKRENYDEDPPPLE